MTGYTTAPGGDKEALESWTLNFQGIQYEREGQKNEDDAGPPGNDPYPG